MEMHQEAEEASGNWNWFLSSFHIRTSLGGLYLSCSGGNTVKDRAGPWGRSWAAGALSGSQQGEGSRCSEELVAQPLGTWAESNRSHALVRLNPQVSLGHASNLFMGLSHLWLLQVCQLPGCSAIREGGESGRERKGWMNEGEEAGGSQDCRRMRTVLP